MDQLRSRTSMIGLFGDNSQINEMDHIDEYSFNLFDVTEVGKKSIFKLKENMCKYLIVIFLGFNDD